LSVLVTGANGFLGSKLVHSLIKEGQDIIAIARRDVPSVYESHPKVRWINRDIAKEGLVELEWSNLDAVVHLAGATLGRGNDEFEFLQANEQTLVRLLQATVKYCSHFVFASSQVVYGDIGSLHVSESQSLRVEGSVYACSKVNSENWIRSFQQRYGGRYLLMRLCGFVDGGGIVDYLIDRALADEPIELFSKGQVRRDYLHSDDGINALLAGVKCIPEEGVHPVNIGSGQAVSSLELAHEVCSELKSASEIRLLDQLAPQTDFVFDIKRAFSLLGFEPENLLQSVRSYAHKRFKAHHKID